jgi:CDP-glucose 4,6-dehydratase
VEGMEVKIMSGVNDLFWKEKNVIITCHTGFKGSWLSVWLQNMGANVCGLALKPENNLSLFNEAYVAEGMQHHIVDIRDLSSVIKIFRDFQPQIVIHMAAQPLVRDSYQNPVETYSTNVMGTVNVLEACRSVSNIKAIVNVTTDKCYENREWIWAYKETDAMGGHDPYSSSKGCSELVSSAYINSYFNDSGVGVGTARAGNVIGGGDWSKDRLVPDILKCFDNNKITELRNPHAIRPWQHVIEPISGYLVLAEQLYSKGVKMSGAWNFGPHEDDAKTVQWISEYLTDKLSNKSDWKKQPGDHPHEANNLKLDISKAKHYLNWKPKWSLNIALDQVIIWHQSWKSGDDLRKICLEQINQYTSRENNE